MEQRALSFREAPLRADENSEGAASSQERHDWARMALLGLTMEKASDLEKALNQAPVLNSETVQQMILEARSGKAYWRGL